MVKLFHDAWFDIISLQHNFLIISFDTPKLSKYNMSAEDQEFADYEEDIVETTAGASKDVKK